jgi:hypothetical protein
MRPLGKANAGIIEILRVAQYVNSWREYRIFVDGSEISPIKRNERIVISVDPGVHVLEARIDWLKSKPMRVNIASGQSVCVVVGCRSLRDWTVLLAVVSSFLCAGLGGMLAGKLGAVVGGGIGGLIFGSVACRPYMFVSLKAAS